MPRNTTKTGVESNAKPARTAQAKPARATNAGEPARKKSSKPAARSANPDNAGSERARDEAREGGPRYGGEAWKVADERGDRRYGHARNDEGEPGELAARVAETEPGEQPTEGDPELADAQGEIESSGQHAGMGRGEKPRKLKSEER